ncbi:hypothetical protein SAMN02745163_00447 [Clostridium cavendishii DSM 21758]|uniref:Uncharacterized protein n=1 Tax=Clostridium cavendishii DSM 21758 TaxID=1121302 RepID=A0A1M6CEI1_9CLOT|nr:hypothetical protein [Clostridium cavendishii]SHI59435.1 hypothetical protein SAMN02745163_00447 [Clostridium cavendishii DSM 21758]
MKDMHSINQKKRQNPSSITNNYAAKIKNKQNQSTPYGDNDPSSRTDFK